MYSGKPQGVYLGHQEKSHQKILLVFLDWILLAKYKNTDHQVPQLLESRPLLRDENDGE